MGKQVMILKAILPWFPVARDHISSHVPGQIWWKSVVGYFISEMGQLIKLPITMFNFIRKILVWLIRCSL